MTSHKFPRFKAGHRGPKLANPVMRTFTVKWEQYAALRQIAEVRNITLSQAAREALDLWLGKYSEYLDTVTPRDNGPDPPEAA